MKIVIGSDHRGREAAHHLADRLGKAGHTTIVLAPPEGETCDYPTPAYDAASKITGGQADLGVLICGTGLGMSIAANKVRGIRAAAVHDEITAELSRTHLDANICCLSADLLGLRLMEKIVDTWTRATFEGGRHARRLEAIARIEAGESPSG